MVLSRKWKRSLAVASLSAALLGIAAPQAFAAEAKFDDVPESHKYYNVINDLTAENVVSGYEDGTFKLGNHLLRSEAAEIFANILELKTTLSTSSFKDVEANKWYTEAINALNEAGHVEGYNNNFDPNREITRAEFVQILVRAYDIPAMDVELPFTDVKEGSWYESAIKTLYGHKLISGTSIDTFGPTEKMKRGDAVWLLANVDYVFGDKLPKPLFELTLMHSNDTHARVDLLPQKVSLVKQLRHENPAALLVDAGDVFSGTLYFNVFEGKADLEFMNLMKYDVATFGNHEFDLGSSPEGHQALADFVAAAKFPFVSANVNFDKDEKFTGLFSDLISSDPENGQIYQGIVKEVKGQKVGFFGLTTEETAGIASPGNITFENYIESAQKAVKAFEDMGVDKIVAITHIGFNDSAEVDNDQLLAAHVHGIDIIVGGHSHTELHEPVVVTEDANGNKKDPTVIVQTGEYNKYLGLLNVKFDENGVVVDANGELRSVGDAEADPEAAEVLKPYAEKVEEVSKQEIGVYLEQALENPRLSFADTSVRNTETILGNLITDGMLAAAKEYDESVIFAVQNGGGIRAAIEAGPVTVGDVITVLPFGNTLSIMKITGAEIKEAFEHSLKDLPGENGGFLHLAGGKVEFDSSKPAQERVVAIYYYNDKGELVEIEDDVEYTIATNYFTAKGGDNYDVFKKIFEAGKVTDLGQSDWENFRKHLESLEEIPTEIEGRLVDLAK